MDNRSDKIEFSESDLEDVSEFRCSYFRKGNRDRRKFCVIDKV